MSREIRLKTTPAIARRLLSYKTANAAVRIDPVLSEIAMLDTIANRDLMTNGVDLKHKDMIQTLIDQNMRSIIVHKGSTPADVPFDAIFLAAKLAGVKYLLIEKRRGPYVTEAKAMGFPEDHIFYHEDGEKISDDVFSKIRSEGMVVMVQSQLYLPVNGLTLDFERVVIVTSMNSASALRMYEDMPSFGELLSDAKKSSQDSDGFRYLAPAKYLFAFGIIKAYKETTET